MRTPPAHLVEPDARRFHGVERLLLHLESGRSFDGARERAPRDGPMIRALGLLQRVERVRVLALPFQPPREAGDRVRFGRAGAFDPEGIAVVVAHSASLPLAVAFGRLQRQVQLADRGLHLWVPTANRMRSTSWAKALRSATASPARAADPSGSRAARLRRAWPSAAPAARRCDSAPSHTSGSAPRSTVR